MGRFFEARKATIMARSARMSKAFTRCAREITIAVKSGGTSPDANPSLRRAIQNARSVDMPKDKIEAAIKRASGEGAEDFQEVIYEGYAPHGIAVVVETATDNPTRTVANVRMHFKKNGGNMGNSGSVLFQFDRMGVFRLDPEGVDQDDLMLALIDHGLEELGESEDDNGNPVVVLRCAFNDFGQLQSGMDEMGIEPKSSGSEYIAQNFVELSEDEANEVLKLVAALEGDDDVQNVFHNLG